MKTKVWKNILLKLEEVIFFRNLIEMEKRKVYGLFLFGLILAAGLGVMIW